MERSAEDLPAFARELIERGEEDRARELAVKYRLSSVNDPDIQRGWAEVFETLGMARQAIECCSRALMARPDDGGSLFLLARLHAEVGHYEKSINLLRRLVKRQPDHKEARRLLAENYRELGLFGQAEVLSKAPPKKDSESPLRTFPPTIGSADTAAILELFSGREVGYALQEIDEATGEATFRYQHEPLCERVVKEHLEGSLTLGVYPLRADNTVKFATLALRLHSGVQEAHMKNPSQLLILIEKLRRHVATLTSLARSLGLAAYPEDAGDNTFRLWFFFAEFQHFLKTRQFLKLFMEAAPHPEGAIVVEPLLGTVGIGMGWIEQALMLPLGIQRTTNRRSCFLDNEGKAHPEQLKFLKKIRAIPFRSALTAVRTRGEPPLKKDPHKPGLPAQAERLLDCCPVLHNIASRAISGHILKRDEQVILFYTIGLIDRGQEALHTLLENTPDYRFQNVKRQAERLKGHPVSCPKIREMLPELTATVGCHCELDLRGGKYPSPVLHVHPHLVPAMGEVISTKGVPVKEAARRYIHLLQHREEIQRSLARLQANLEDHFAKTGETRIKCGVNHLVRVCRGDEVIWEMEVL